MDVLVNKAEMFATVPLESITVDPWDKMFETNTRGAFLMVQAVHPHLKASRGHIINIGSLPWATHGHYSTAHPLSTMYRQSGMMVIVHPNPSEEPICLSQTASPESDRMGNNLL